MNISVNIDQDVLAVAIAEIMEEEIKNPCGIAKKLRAFCAGDSGMDRDRDVRWALDTMIDACNRSISVN